MAIVNHDYPGTNDLLVVNATNEPVEGAEIRVYGHTEFQAGLVDTWEAMTVSDADGKWVDPIVLDDGRSWVVHMQKPSVYGPVHVEITT